MKKVSDIVFKILVINPGSTSTKFSLFENDKVVMTQTLRHTGDELQQYAHIADQFSFRKHLILSALQQNNINILSLSAIIGRGGLLHPIPSGVYEVNEAMKTDLIHAKQEHASNLGGLLAADIAAQIPGARAFIADPVVVDEMDEVARISGHPLFERLSIFHALNQKAVAKGYAASIGQKYQDLNLIVAHLGGGVSVGVHHSGRVIDVNNALDGEGPISPERSGTLPSGQLVTLCFSGKYTEQQVRQMIVGKGGMFAFTGTNDLREILELSKNGNQQASKIIDAFCYNVAKSIGASAAVLKGKVDAIIITGGIAYSNTVCDKIKVMTEFIAPNIVIAGEDEMEALAINALQVLNKEQVPLEYK